MHCRELPPPPPAYDSRNFTLSPETTDCDSADLESELSVRKGIQVFLSWKFSLVLLTSPWWGLKIFYLKIIVYAFFRFPQQQIVKAPITPLAQESTLPCPYLRWVLPMAYFLPILEVSLFTMWWHWWSRKDYPKPEIKNTIGDGGSTAL